VSSPLPATEAENPATADLDRLEPIEAVRRLAGLERRSPEAVLAAAPGIARLVERAAAALAKGGSGGRLIFVGAGTSGRLGALEAAECPPTFGVAPGRVEAIVAGGEAALARAVEGAEDRAEDGAAAVAARGAGPRDLVVGIAASGRTPFVRGALAEARRRGAATGLVTCDPATAAEAPPPADEVVLLDVGPEAVTGSTRLKAGTATKIALNALTTATFVRLGAVHGNLMVDLVATNRKLEGRARRIVRRLCGCDEGEAARLLAASGGRVKEAVLVSRRGLSLAAAESALRAAGGCLRRALDAGAPESAPETA